MAGLLKIKEVMTGARVAGDVVGAAFGEGFTILHETVKHVGGETIKFNKSILKSLEDGIAPEVENLQPLLPPETEINNIGSSIATTLDGIAPLDPLLPPEAEINDIGSSIATTLDGIAPLDPLLPPEAEINDIGSSIATTLDGIAPLYMEEDCALLGNPAEDEMKQRERMAILVTNIANIVLFALKVFASIESKSLSIIASILDPFFDLLWGFILWLTSHAMQNPNPHKYPIGMNRLQPVGMIVFGSFGLQLLFLAAKQFITKSKPEKDPQKEKWMIGVMTFVTMVEFMLAFYCRRFENKIVRAYAEHHSSNAKTNLISLAAAVLAIRYYWWIDPTGAIIILSYTMNKWKETFFENLFALIGRTAPPEILEKLTNLILNHDEDIKQIGRVRAYTFGSDQYFVEVEIVLPQDMVLSKTHDIGETLQVKLEQLPEIVRAFVHIDSEYTHRDEHRTTV